MKFINSLLSDTPHSLSSKRFVAIIGAFCLFIVMLANTFFKFTVAEFIFYGILGFVGTLFGANTFLTANKKSGQVDVSSSLIKHQPISDKTQDTVKEIIK
jgi:hypothetical protein